MALHRRFNYNLSCDVPKPELGDKKTFSGMVLDI
jgi:hypothetical protein